MSLKYLTFFIIISISITLIIPTSDIFAQEFRTFEDIGGGSSSNNSQGNSDNSLIYIVGGAVIVGIVAYALLRDKSDKKKAKSDSSEVSLNENLQLLENPEVQISKIKDKIPLDFYFGMTNETAYLSGKKYLLGVSYRF